VSGYLGGYFAASGGTSLPSPDLTLTSPSLFQVFQRSGTTGTITVTGSVTNGPWDIFALYGNSPATTIGLGISGAFSGSLTGRPQGQTTFTLQMQKAGVLLQARDVQWVGIGDVFVIGGQSNAVGHANNLQTYSNPQGIKAGLYDRNTNSWKELVDPTDPLFNGGSVWPIMATSYLASQGIPCAFIPCAVTNTSSANWQPGQSTYTSMTARVTSANCGGTRAFLFWQGETDATNSVSQATYHANISAIAAQIAIDLGAKMINCKIQNCSGIPIGQQTPINAAIGAGWTDISNMAAGPDLSDLLTDDGLHLEIDSKVQTAGARWWSAVKAVYGWA
jgi:hypothetical protein